MRRGKNVTKIINIDRQMVAEIGSYATKILGALSEAEESEESEIHGRLQWKQKLIAILNKNHEYLRELGVSIPQIE